MARLVKNALIAAALRTLHINSRERAQYEKKLRFLEILLVLVRLDHVPASGASKLDNFRFQFGLRFAFRDE
jgi:hypothetical protein